MPKKEEGVEYLNATEAAKVFGISRQLFDLNVQPFLEKHYLPGRKYPFYKSADVYAWKNRPEEAEIPILIQGIQKTLKRR